MAVDNLGNKQWTVLDRATTAHSVCTFLQSLAVPPGTSIVLDNASVHRTHAVQAAAVAKGYSLLYIPPSTPENNPIELVFSKVKRAFYKARCSHTAWTGDLRQHIDRAVATVSAMDVVHCFQHTVRVHWARSNGVDTFDDEGQEGVRSRAA